VDRVGLAEGSQVRLRVGDDLGSQKVVDQVLESRGGACHSRASAGGVIRWKLRDASGDFKPTFD
jgi:hypothetical protein